VNESVRRYWRREAWLVGGILLLATVLRAGWPRLTEFKFSEARLEALALGLTQGGHLPLVGVPSSAGFDHSPLSVYLYVPAFLFTSNPLPATVYGGLVGVAAVALNWWLARRWAGGGRWAAAVSSFLLAVSPWAVAFSRKIWQVVFVAPLTLALVGLLLSATVDKKHGRLAWAVALYSLLVQIHPSAIALAPAIVLWLVLFWHEVRPGPLLAGIGLGGLAGLPFLVHQAQSGWPVLAALRNLPAARLDWTALHLAWEAITGRGIHALAGDAYPLLRVVPSLGWTFNLVGWLTVAAGLWLAWRTVRNWRSADLDQRNAARIDLVLLSWLVVPVVFNLRHSLDLYLHFFVLVMPAAYLMIGRAVEGLNRHAFVKRQALVVGLVVVVLLGTAQVVALSMMGRFVASHDTPGGFETPLGTYMNVTDRAVAAADGVPGAAEVLVVGEGDSPVVDQDPALFDVLLRGRVTYRFVDGRSAALFPSHRTVVLLTPQAGQMATWYTDSAPAQTLPAAEGYRLVEMDGSWPEAAFEPVSGPRLFQNGVEMQGYLWKGQAAACEPSRVWLLWQVLWRAQEDSHFYVQLLDAGNQVLGQSDAPGYANAYRQPGDHIISEFDISSQQGASIVPAWLRAGLYLYPSVQAVPLVDSSGNPVGDLVLMGPLG
jgi:hypothetical protein